MATTTTTTANQGFKFLDVTQAVGNLLLVTTQFDTRHVRRWYGSNRTLAGQDYMVWYRPTTFIPDLSTGPVQFGNKVELNFELHLVTRSFADEAQIDEQREALFWNAYWQVVLAFQNRNLFKTYTQPTPTTAWVQPVPTNLNNLVYTVGETMLLKSIPVPDKTQREEGTIEAKWELKVPTVLALTLP